MAKSKDSKDFIKFRANLRNKNLSVNEQFLLEYLFELHNTNYGYSFPSFTAIMKAFNTTSKNRISSIIKKLEDKKLLTVDRSRKSNRYYIAEVENFINIKDAKEKKVKNHEEERKKQLTDVEIKEKFNELDDWEILDLKLIYEELNIDINKAYSMYLDAGKDIKKVLDIIEYSKSKKIKSLIPYIAKVLKNCRNKEFKFGELFKPNIKKDDNYDWVAGW